MSPASPESSELRRPGSLDAPSSAQSVHQRLAKANPHFTCRGSSVRAERSWPSPSAERPDQAAACSFDGRRRRTPPRHPSSTLSSDPFESSVWPAPSTQHPHAPTPKMVAEATIILRPDRAIPTGHKGGQLSSPEVTTDPAIEDGGTGRWSIPGERSDAVDLDELTLVSEGRNPKEGARWAVGRQCVLDQAPGCSEIVHFPNHVDRRLHEVFRTGAVVLQELARRLWTTCSTCLRRSPIPTTDPSASSGQAPAVNTMARPDTTAA